MNAVSVAGPVDADPVIFLHGASANLEMWRGQVDRLKSEFLCIAIDLPGHGERISSRFSLEAAVAVVHELLDELKRPVTLVGLSLGGYVAIAAADHPRAAGLVLSGSAVEFTGLTAWVNRFQGLVLPALGPLVGKRAADSLRKVAPPGVGEAIALRGLSFSGAGRALRDLAGRDFHSLLVRYQGPVLMLMGERDKHNLAALPRMTAGLANVEVEILEDSGHACALSRPDAFSDAVARHVRRVVADSPNL